MGPPRIASSRVQLRALSTSQLFLATPLPVTAQGPPPPPPLPAASHPESRIAHQRKRAAQIAQAQSLRASLQPSQQSPDSPQRSTQNPSSPDALRKRFWKNASVNPVPEGLQILLDSRPLRTSSAPRSIITLPPSKRFLSLLLAQEWDALPSASHALKQHNIPLTSLVNRALGLQQSPTYISPLQPPTSELREQTVKDRREIVEMCMRYLDTDTVLCYAPETRGSLDRDRGSRQVEERESLRDMQIAASQPILNFIRHRLFPGIEISPHTTDQLVPEPQPETSKKLLEGWITGLPCWELAALERMVLATKSLLIGIRMVAEWSPVIRAQLSDGPSEELGIQEAYDAATVEVRWQTIMWGEVEDTHDVDKEDMKRHIGSAILLLDGSSAKSQ